MGQTTSSMGALCLLSDHAREYIRDCGLIVPRAFQCLTIEWADLSLATTLRRADLHRRCTEGQGRHYATRIDETLAILRENRSGASQ
jgi:hypothetical protein